MTTVHPDEDPMGVATALGLPVVDTTTQTGNRQQSTKTVIRHLKALVKHLEENDFSTPAQDRAIRAAIAILQSPTRKSFALVTGNPFDGLNLHGPFQDAESANAYADNHHSPDDFWVVPVYPPDSEY